MTSPFSFLDPTSVLLGGVVLLCVLWWLSTRRPPSLPPGPGPALPLLGHLHLLAKDPRPQLCTWRRQYGDVFSLYMGGRLVVVLASYSAIREALVTMADVFSDQPHIFVMDHIWKSVGVLGSSGSQWKEWRQACLEILRAMGMGKNVLADKMQEITHYIRAIKDHQGAPVRLAHTTQVSISNNICSIILGKRFDHNDPELISYLKCMDEVMKLIPGRRVCLGESMARMELFLYLATLVQHFRFLPPEEGQMPSLERVPGATVTPQPYKIRTVPRM